MCEGPEIGPERCERRRCINGTDIRREFDIEDKKRHGYREDSVYKRLQPRRREPGLSDHFSFCAEDSKLSRVVTGLRMESILS